MHAQRRPLSAPVQGRRCHAPLSASADAGPTKSTATSPEASRLPWWWYRYEDVSSALTSQRRVLVESESVSTSPLQRSQSTQALTENESSFGCTLSSDRRPESMLENEVLKLSGTRLLEKQRLTKRDCSSSSPVLKRSPLQDFLENASAYSENSGLPPDPHLFRGLRVGRLPKSKRRLVDARRSLSVGSLPRLSSEFSEPLKGMRRSSALLAVFEKVRRAGGDADKRGSLDGSNSKPLNSRRSIQDEAIPCMNYDDDSDLSILVQTLADTEDTPESLQTRIKELKELENQGEELGGSAHATSHVSYRARQIMEKKSEFLDEMARQISDIQAAGRKKDRTLEAIVNGLTASEVGIDMQALRKFAQSTIHKDGLPQDANKCNFPHFLKTFGLHPKHKMITYSLQVVEEEGKSWADAVLQYGEENVEAVGDDLIKVEAALAEMISLLMFWGVASWYEPLRKACVIRVKLLAQAESLKDERFAAQSQAKGIPIPSGSAAEAALRIGIAIQQTLALMPDSISRENFRDQMRDAERVVKALREKDDLRARIESIAKKKAETARNKFRASLAGEHLSKEGGDSAPQKLRASLNQ